jgi:hypothetical protein
MGPAISDRCLIGAISISIAVTKPTKSPTVEPPPRLCHSATTMTAESAQAASTWVSGVVVERSASLTSPKRPLWAPAAACRRTMRQASTFSSTT